MPPRAYSLAAYDARSQVQADNRIMLNCPQYPGKELLLGPNRLNLGNIFRPAALAGI